MTAIRKGSYRNRSSIAFKNLLQIQNRPKTDSLNDYPVPENYGVLKISDDHNYEH